MMGWEFKFVNHERIASKLSSVPLERVIEDLVTDVTHFAEGSVADRTPRVTGHAKRSTMSIIRRGGVRSRGRVVLRYPYAGWLETGTDSRGRQMKSRVGGYRMVERALEDTKIEFPTLAARAIRMLHHEFSRGT